MTALLLSLALALPSGAKELGRVSSRDGLTLTFRASPVANLVYQLNCLAGGLGSCTTKAYRDFWNADGWSPEDEAAIARWKALMKRYDHNFDLESEPPTSAMPLEPRGVGLLERIRIAGYRSETWDDYEAGLQLLMTADDAREAVNLTQRFRERFGAWWKKQGRERAEDAAKGFRDLSEKHALPDFYGKVARFYGYAFPAGTTVEFDVMAQPDNDAHLGHGECLGDHAVVEIDPEKSLERKLTVVSHELFHYFYGTAPLAVREKLVAGFAEAPEAYAFAAYGVLNEAVATALGQGIVQRMIDPKEYELRRPEKDGFYAEPLVNDAARALVEPLAGMLERGVTIADSAFVADYVDALSEAVGPRLSSPAGWFRGFASVRGPAMDAAQEKFREHAESSSIWGFTFGEEAVGFVGDHSGISAVFFLKPDELGELKRWANVIPEPDRRKIEARAKDPKPFVYGAKRSDKAYLYVFVGADADALAPVIDAFFKSPSMPAGLLP